VGIHSPMQANASLALGTAEVTPLELTAAYAVFANGGYRVQPYMVTRIDIGGRPVYTRAAPQPQRVLDHEVVQDLNAMMYGVVIGGTGGNASLKGREAAGKTGTTQDSKDAWFVGYTTDYVAAAWIGNDDAKPTRNVTGGTLPAYIWRDTMLAAEKGLPFKPLDKSEKPPEADLLMASDVIWGGPDEESLARAPDLPEEPVEEQPRRRRGGLLGWLFGDDADDQPPPPPR
jgi:penicillin-binding protein 1A